MNRERLYALLADAVLILHFAIVIFVVGGLVLILVGNLRGWRWVNGVRFRLLHIAAIGIVVVQAWLGATCPLTTLEMALRTQAGATPYDGSFIAYWLGRILFYQAPEWVFTLVYSLFGLLVAVTWWRFPPALKR